MQNDVTEAEKLFVNVPPVSKKVTSTLVIGVFSAVVGFSFQYGYNIAVVNAPADEIKEFFFPISDDVVTCTSYYNSNVNRSNVGTTLSPISISEDDCRAMESSHTSYQNNTYAVAVGIFAAAGMIGSLLVGPIVKKFGRLGSMMVSNSLSLLAALLMGLSSPVKSFILLVIGRFFIGVFGGLATGLVPIYIGEISPKEWRGSIGVLNQLLITIGILVSQIFGLSSILGSDSLWPFLFAFTAVMSLTSVVCYPFMPKSPRYLLIDLNEEAEARKTLVDLRGTSRIELEVIEMKNEASQQANEGQMTIGELLKERSVRWQLITIASLMAAQQLSGINAVFFYSNTIFERAGIPKGFPQDIASICVGTVNVAMTIAAVLIIDRVGRKPLLKWGFASMIFWCIALTIVLNLSQAYEDIEWVSYLSAACIIGYIIGFAVGPGPIPWLLTAELFRQSARPPATMISCVVNWFCNFLVGIGFPAVAEITGPYVFLGFTVVCILITMYISAVLPETKGKTFQEISNLFAKRNQVAEVSTEDERTITPSPIVENPANRNEEQLIVQELTGSEEKPIS